MSDTTSVRGWLQKHNLQSLSPQLKELGVEHMADLAILDVEDISRLRNSLKKIQRKKLGTALADIGVQSADHASSALIAPAHRTPDRYAKPRLWRAHVATCSVTPSSRMCVACVFKTLCLAGSCSRLQCQEN